MDKRTIPSLVAIDDEVDFLELIRRVSDSIDFHSFITTDPNEFLDRVRSTSPDVVVIDLNMPQQDGIELLRKLAILGVKSQIVVASGFDRRVTDTALRLGSESGLKMAPPLEKPAQIKHLREALSSLAPLHKFVTRESLSDAVSQQQFTLHYQPRLNLRTGELGSVEALIRWNHPAKGLIYPGEFIPIAETTGIIHEITSWVFSRALSDCAQWRRRGIHVGVAVNISANDVSNVALPDFVDRLCRSAGIQAGSLTIELTETAAALHRTLLMDVMARFRLKGFLLSLDDFGTGYSSLSMLQKLPFSELKIDKSFVQTMATNKDNRIIAKATIAMAKALNLETVAEGVEDVQSLEMLREFACDYAQGFLIAKPLDAEGLALLLAENADIESSGHAAV